ncbi:hypothetical protein ACVOZ6_005224, partial [Escherichia coli]
MAKATALLMSSVTGAFNSRPFFIVNLNRIGLYFLMFYFALPKVRNRKPRTVPAAGVLFFYLLPWVRHLAISFLALVSP